MRTSGQKGAEYASSFEVQRLLQASNEAASRGDLQAVIDNLSRAAKLAPGTPRLHSSLGNALLLVQRPSEAEIAFNTALRFDPRDPVALAGKGEIRYAAQDFEEAEGLLRAAVELDPSNARAHLVLVDCLAAQNRLEEAGSEAKAAIAAHPLDAVPHSAYGTRLQQLGRFEEAESQFSEALALNPADGLAHLGRSQHKRFSETDRPLIGAMESVVEQPQLDWKTKSHVLFALGKAYDDLKEYRRAMECFIAANKIEDQALSFRQEEYLRVFGALPKLFSREFIESHRSPNEFSPKPIFIVGMMRSGTTLVEQILSSHPSVAAGGEIVYWKPKTFECIDFDRMTFDLNHALGARKKYNKRLRAISPTARFVTDKMPENYQALGTISLMYPEAKIIHCSRNAVDTCLSIFTTPFQQPPDYSSDPTKLVFMFRQYRQLMKHWKSALPANSLLEVKYEDLIDDRERVTKQVIQFCGLEWDDACLHFESNSRTVTTASLWQVRQPIYRTSVARWRNYEPWLGALAELLDDSDSKNLE